MPIKRVAIIGLGQQTQSEIIPALQLCKKLISVVAICDVSPQLIQQSGKIFPKAKTFTDYHELFDRGPVIDIIVVCVPHFLYFDICMRALEKGIAVFKEKPLALDMGEAVQLCRISQAKNVPLYTVTKRKYYKSYQRGHELLGEIGRVYQYGARHFISTGNMYLGWRSARATAGGGVFIDMGYHLVDVLLRFFGEVESSVILKSNAGAPDFSYEVEDAATVLLKHARGVNGCFQLGCLCGPKEESIEIHGTEGTLRIWKDRVVLLTKTGKVKLEEHVPADGIGSVAEAFRLFLQSNREVWLENLVHNLRIMNLITQAYAKNL